MLNQNNLNGKMIGLRYKYGDKTIFDSFEKCISLVREYPIVYIFIPEEYNDIIDYCINLGIEDAYIQEGEAASESFIPVFDGSH